MQLLVLCPHFAPDTAPTGEVMTAIVGGLAERGHQLHVVTSLPWYQHHRVEPGWRGRIARVEHVPWGRITRLHPWPTDKRDLVARAAAFAGFTAEVAAAGLLDRRRADAVIAMSPPLTLGAAGRLVALRHRAPLVFNVQDVFPDVAVELGAITDRRVIRAARWLERATYLASDAVTVLSEDLRANVAAKVGQRRPERVRVIPNFVDTERIRPLPTEGAYRAEHGLSGKRVVMYAGNVGWSQSLELVLAAAEATADDPGVAYVVNGGGSALDDLRARAAHLPNVVFVGFQPRDRLPEVLAAADVHVVPLKRGLARSSVPSKTYSILAAGRPLVASVDEGTEVARTVEAAGAGLAVPPDDPAAFVAAVRSLLDRPEEAAAMGAAGRRWVERWASPAAVAAAYEDLVGELVAARRRRGGRSRSR